MRNYSQFEAQVFVYQDQKNIHVLYVLKKVILWKQRMHQRAETRECKFSGPDLQCGAILLSNHCSELGNKF